MELFDFISDPTKTTDGLRRCSRCGEAKRLEEMTGGHRAVRGVGRECRDCRSKRAGSSRRYKPPIVILSAAQAAYLAGLLDGEGCIGLVRGKNPAGRVWYNARITVGMTGLELFGVQKELGIGRIFTYDRRNANAKPCHHWVMGSNDARSVLPLVLPYLRFKRDQAALLLEYLDLALHAPKRNPDRTKAHRERVHGIWLAMKRLNQRGVSTDLTAESL